LRVLQAFKDKTRVTLQIPLGSRGKWRGAEYEVVGYQLRSTTADGITYSWSEYLLFNPYQGFRYLTEYRGHWNDVRTLRQLPAPGTGSKPTMRVNGVTYIHFSSADAVTSFVLGEFPWQVRRGEKVGAKDYVAPPRILSAEATPGETTWSIGEYVKGDEIWQAFKLPGKPPTPSGIYLNQPSPYAGKTKEVWNLSKIFLLICFAGVVLSYIMAGNKEVFRQSFRYPSASGQAAHVTKVFDIDGRTSNVEISTRTDLSNNWAFLNLALINDVTGQTFECGREISYYSGSDSDGSWTEGSAGDSVTIPSVPAGKYYLRIEPDMEGTGAAATPSAPPAASESMVYDIRVRRDVPHQSHFWIVSILLLIPLLFVMMRSASFEAMRWRESDYSTSSSSSGDDD
ncbi:MAG: DUF4178 domain-containing protein, partial [Bryobacteraceae bacterium]